MYEGWFAFGGQEVANNERYAAYAAALGLPVPAEACACGKLPAVLADDPYGGDGLTGAPWADPGAPEAAGFAGLFVHTITGLDQATSAREVTAGVDGGGIPGPPRSAPRTILVTAFAAATGEASLAYGLAWLDAVLHDDCADACTGATLCMLAECPTCDTADSEAADACWEAAVRTLHDVVCIDGPRVTARHDLAGGVGATVEFTLVAAVPHIYRAPAAVATAAAFTDPPPSDGCDITWQPVGAGRGACPPPQSCAPAAGSCLTDPHARPIPTLPPPAPAPGACITRYRSAWALAAAPAGLLPHWLDSVPVVTVKAGEADLRRLTLRFHPNPAQVTYTDPDQLDPCTALVEINLTYLPRDTTLVIDGRSQQAYAVCPGGVIEPADAVLYGPDGGPWDWPRLTCGAALTVVALVDAEHYSPAARLDVALAARQDVA